MRAAEIGVPNRHPATRSHLPPFGRTGRTALAALTLFCLAPSSARAIAELVVQVEGGDPATEVSVTLQAADGHSQDVTGSGETFAVTPTGPTGEYQVTLRAGTANGSVEVQVPESGLVTLTFRVATGEILASSTCSTWSASRCCADPRERCSARTPSAAPSTW